MARPVRLAADLRDRADGDRGLLRRARPPDGVPDLPRTYPAQAAYLAGCERTRFAPSEAGRRASARTLAMVRAHVPWPFRPLVVPVFATLLSPSARAAVGLADAPAAVRWAVPVALAARRRIVRLLPPRHRPTTPRTRRNLPPARRAPGIEVAGLG
ncbi:hypothetical protein [Cryptosporangium aurantiacum]|uniref:hypothetical protein n=1 Tax=Cryptosporangium aurantiacum TaxID=134849 RepID=UPI001161152E|nr:hypothetical protein [Cryptosporangium aurantiacum]